MKQLGKFTLKEWNSYVEAINGEPDFVTIFEIFGLDALAMPFDEFEKSWKEIQSMQIRKVELKKVYVVNGKRYKALLNPLKLKAGQWIDYQNYVRSGSKLNQILSVFLVPQYRTWTGWKTYSYGSGYDPVEVQNELQEHFLAEDAMALSNFFLRLSSQLATTIKNSLTRKKWKMLKSNKKQLL